MDRHWSFALVSVCFLSPLVLAGQSSSGIDFRHLREIRQRPAPEPKERSDRADSDGNTSSSRPASQYERFRLEITAAIKQRDYQEALRLALAQQELEDTSNLRDYIVDLKATVSWNEGVALEDKGDKVGALVLLKQALELKPEKFSADDRIYVDSLQFKSEREATAMRILEKEKEQTARNATRVAALVEAGIELMNQGNDEAALAKAEEALKLQGTFNDPSFLYWIANGSIALRGGHLDAVIRDLKQALVYRPDDPNAQRALSLAEKKREELRVAVVPSTVHLLDRIAAPSLLDTMTVDARGLTGSDLPKQASEIERSPAIVEARKGFRAVMAHDWPVAVAWYQLALAKDPANPALMQMVDLASWTLHRNSRLPGAAQPLPHPAQGGKAASSGANVPSPSAAPTPGVQQAIRHLTVSDEATLKRLEQITDAAMGRDFLEGLSNDSAHRALSLLQAGHTQEAMAEIELASRLSPWVPNYQNALNALLEADGQRSVVGRRPHAQLDFMVN